MELKTEDKKLNSELIGIYEYRTENKSENHYIVIDTINGKLSGVYFGTEDSGGHGVFFYGNEMENLTLESKNISFEIGRRELYASTRMRIIKNKKDLEIDSTSGVSKSRLKYKGDILKNGFKLTCKSEYGDCWWNEMSFYKLSEQK